ncbi:MAG: trypsin-like peptidase domain-containing protein [Actinobacteria bacterium]|nr:trypsin-like peptidase domain-containing protein [Actinomycetota bacterium]
MLTAAGVVGSAVTIGAASAFGALGSSTTTVREITPPVGADSGTFVGTAKAMTIHDVYVRDAPGVVQLASAGRPLGSGFVVDKVGHIVTNAGVVEDAAPISVSFSNRERMPATVVGRDPSTDLAVLQVHISSRALTPLALGESADLRVGDPVVAIGNPLGDGRSVTAGIVSALDHGVRTDAKLSHGTWGGPLVNAQGAVVGVTSLSRDGSGVAIPIDTVRIVVAELIASGHVEHPFIGVQTRAITPAVAELFRLPVSRGLLVSTVCSSTGAASAGLHGATQEVTVAGNTWPIGGDIIVKADGVPVGSVGALRALVTQMQPGQSMTLDVVRGTKTLFLHVKLGRQPLSPRC